MIGSSKSFTCLHAKIETIIVVVEVNWLVSIICSPILTENTGYVVNSHEINFFFDLNLYFTLKFFN